MSLFSSRTELLLGKEATEKLASAHILCVGAGGVGGHAIEMIARAGIGHITIVDGDTVEPTNLNRQIAATLPAIGQPKALVMEERLRQINPDIMLKAMDKFLYEQDIAPLLDSDNFTFIIDAIDSVATKCELISQAFERGIPIISSMGAGARTDACKVHIVKLSRTHHDGLSKAVRKRLTGTGIPDRLDVAFSEEESNPNAVIVSDMPGRKMTVGTVSWIPAVFGCHIAQYVITKILKQ